ncbi:MFS general substrate transporter [Metschnikowia bicuspidata var. bicuspidata NRRL YB-4993]|uniref:MFS general substrate transporter n=1 Tax=Metschnikowia bicuspidata var. bicuspidata NRRL YB-4993 TaxID=869754 RepID=A0A1A0HCS4_9ASCO|nr:MFS general substrate transporter [Metschnikowia bicuspidata var. bicuspidata NRRL YB-4993]OBA21904.1 MFS general substrate transporter [Metschnikowia bicuspidata var. bicuspidata NRRL YB-4993]
MIPSSVHKTLVLLSCTFLGLICGTLYLYLSYSPQLAQRLQYLATNALSIALVGSLGVAVSGPMAGLAVDRKGYTGALCAGGSLIVLGYFVLRRQYTHTYLNVALSCLCLFSVGAGSTLINLACLKCCAVTFPSLRGVATSLPLALYGLSAMFYLVVALVFYAGDTAGFLRFLMASVAALFALCSPCVMLCDRRPCLSGRTVRLADSIEMVNLRGLSEMKGALSPCATPTSGPADLHGLALLRLPRFWLLFLITGAMASLGQMYIYSVGYMVKALVIRNFDIDAAAATSLSVDMVIQNQQQVQVALLSMTNCVGRLVAGVMGDIISQTFRKLRAWLLFVPGVGLVCTQVLGHAITSHEYLGVASMLSGFFYGYTLCIMPTIVGDAFGIANFSGNWGLVGLAPVVPSFVLTNLFGKVYDSKSAAGVDGVYTCTLGSRCYSLVFNLSLGVSILALLVVGVLNFGDRYYTSRALATKGKLAG